MILRSCQTCLSTKSSTELTLAPFAFPFILLRYVSLPFPSVTCYSFFPFRILPNVATKMGCYALPFQRHLKRKARNFKLNLLKGDAFLRGKHHKDLSKARLFYRNVLFLSSFFVSLSPSLPRNCAFMF
jgi:hypothetical protein